MAPTSDKCVRGDARTLVAFSFHALLDVLNLGCGTATAMADAISAGAGFDFQFPAALRSHFEDPFGRPFGSHWRSEFLGALCERGHGS